MLARLAGQARLTVVTTHHPELKEWASATDGAANAATGLDPETHAPLYRIVLGRPGTSHALQTAERLGLDESVVADARSRVAPERLRIAELLAEAEAAERAAAEEREAAARERAEATRARRAGARARRASSRRRSRRCARRRRGRASTRSPRPSATSPRRAPSCRRCATRSASRAAASSRRGEARPRASVEAERDRDRRLGAASTRAARAERALRALDEPLALQAPLAVGDPVEAPALGAPRHDRRDRRRRGGGRRRAAASASGSRSRGCGPTRTARDPDERAAPAVRVLASARSDVSDELDVRGHAAQEAREAVRSFVDDAALAGLAQVRVIHGRGTGAVRTAVRDELDRHPLVERRETESADGATVVYLGSTA